MRIETVDWRLPYIGFIFVGAIISSINIRFMNNIINIIAFVIGIYISSTGDYVGIYKPLSYVENYLGLDLKVLGVALILIAVSNSDKLKRIFDTSIGRWISKYSMAIYVIHWGIVISLSCGITYHLSIFSGLPYMLSGLIGIAGGLLATLLLAVIFTEDVYNPYCKVILKRIQKLMKSISEESDEGKNSICNSISKMS